MTKKEHEEILKQARRAEWAAFWCGFWDWNPGDIFRPAGDSQDRAESAMTEKEWLTGADPAAMLRKIVRNGVPRRASEPGGNKDWASDRKLRLFGEACCLLTGGSPMNSERLANSMEDPADWARQWAGRNLTAGNSRIPQDVKTNLLREIVGNPFRPYMREDAFVAGGPIPGPKIRIVWNAWLSPTVVALARAAYSERAGRKCGRCDGTGEMLRSWTGGAYFPDGVGRGEYKTCPDCGGTGRIDAGKLDNDRLAVLADALEEAGCTDPTILEHLRSPGPHVRGCWALDLLLGRR